MKCEEKERLLAAYQKGIALYSLALAQMVDGIRASKPYEDLRELTENARMKSENARLELDAHISEHGC